MTNLYLNDEEQAMLNGAFGPGVQRAMEIVATLGRIYGAPDLAPITHAQIAGVSYKNIGDAGVAFLSAWAAEGARVRVPTMLNPMGMEEARWQEMGVAEAFAKPQLEAIGAFSKLGVQQTLTCVPYLLPEAGLQRGDHVAWAESSAVAFGSSILALRTNREGGPSALAAAIVGRTARYGYHLDQGRQANWVIEVACPVRSIADFGALGYL
ncbi:MAG: aconitase X, partial [Anaerolineae bacterium]